MTLTALKTVAAIWLLVPVMAAASESRQLASTTSYSFTDIAGTNLNPDQNASGFLTFDASWKGLLFGFGSVAETQVAALPWRLSDANGKAIFQQGVLANLAGNQNEGLNVLNGNWLGEGEYKPTLGGIWSVSATGIQDNWQPLGAYVGLGTETYPATNPVSSVPEPENYSMLLAGLGLMGTIALRRKKSGVS